MDNSVAVSFAHAWAEAWRRSAVEDFADCGSSVDDRSYCLVDEDDVFTSHGSTRRGPRALDFSPSAGVLYEIECDEHWMCHRPFECVVVQFDSLLRYSLNGCRPYGGAGVCGSGVLVAWR